MRKRLAIIGGGASGVSLAWLAAESTKARADWDIVLFHDEPTLGGHSHSIPVELGGQTFPIDIGVQFVAPSLYPHVFSMLRRPEFRERVPMEAMPPIRMTAACSPDHNWSTDGARLRSAPERFSTVNDAQIALAREFQRDVSRCLWTKLGGESAAGLSLARYFELKPHLRDSEFFAFGLIPLLSIINGYTAYDLLETRLGDLLPLLTRLPGFAGPLMALDQPGRGWHRFVHGAQSWVEAMAELAGEAGVRVELGAPVRAVEPSEGRVRVAWGEQEGSFDEVVLTTDMATNRELLQGPDADQFAPYISQDRFPLLPGVCFIHQDETILAPHLQSQGEDLQFTAAYAWDPEGDHPYGLPYDLHSCFATHVLHPVLGLPEPCYVTMYAEGLNARWPDESKVLHRKEWRHGRWMSSYFKEGKEELHRIQGRRGVWFAGNNTTFDSEEGALLSALGVAEQLFDGFKNPFGGPRALLRPAGIVLYRHFVRGTMFPKQFRRTR